MIPRLHSAVLADHEVHVLELLKAGTDANLLDENNRTPILYAKSAKMVKLLLENGASLDLDNNGVKVGKRVLDNAVYRNNEDTVRLMLKHNVDINSGYRSAIHYASSREMAKLLIRNGAVINRRNSHDQSTPLLSVLSIMRVKLIDSARGYSRFREYPRFLNDVRWTRYMDVVQVLIERGADVNCQDTHGRTAIHIVQESQRYPFASKFPAIAIGNVVRNLLSVLVEYGFNVNLQDELGRTPLHLALLSKEIPTIIRLIEYGADVTVKDHRNISPLEDAMRGEMNFSLWSFKKHIVKLKVAGLPVSNKNLKAIGYNLDNAQDVSLTPEDLMNMEIKCQRELDTLKCFKLSDNMNLYHVLTTDDPEYLMDRRVFATLDSVYFKSYPLYGILIKKKLASAKKRTLHARAARAFHSILGASQLGLPSLPYELVEVIVRNLNSDEQVKLSQFNQGTRRIEYNLYSILSSIINISSVDRASSSRV